MMTEAIDIFCHCLPPAFCEAAHRHAIRPLHMLSRAQTIPVMVDLAARLALMDQFPGYRQVLSLASPPIELIAGPETTPEIARIANDALAALGTREPDRLP